MRRKTGRVLLLPGLLLLASCGGGGGGTPPPPACAESETIACTQSGALRGVIEGNIRAFRGIPFAAPPLGNLRWKPPAPPVAWQGVRDASQFGSVCTQINFNLELVGEEDCLFVNVFTSSPAPKSKQPVMVFFHGGGDEAGDTHQAPFDSPSLAAAGVVVVTAEYRLGVLGFLANPLLTAEGGGTSGQYAILDMVAALTWVKNNIAHFGGDPNQVMLFGQSAGSFNIQMMLAIAPAHGLFNVAGMESGAIPSINKAPWLPTQPVADAASAPFVAAMGCANAAGVLACLRSVSADTMVNYAWNSPFIYGPGVGSPFLPVDSFTYLQQHGSPVPLLIGTTREEYLGVSDNPNSPLDAAGYTAEIHTEFDKYGNSVADQVLSLYPVTGYDTPEYALDAVHSDYQITCEIRNTALAALGAQRPPVWRYLYTHRFENGSFLAPYRAFHTAELFFIFGNFSNIAGSEYFPSSAETDFSQAMMGYWTRFAATGDPNGVGATQWLPYDAANEHMLQLDETFAPIDGYHTPQCNYLSTLPQP